MIDADEYRLNLFALRCEAQAMLVTIGEIDRQDAVDELQLIAEEDGLAEFDQDLVQSLMAAAFSPHRLYYTAGVEDDESEDADVSFDSWCEHCQGYCPAPWFCDVVEAIVIHLGPARVYEPEPRPLVAGSVLEAFQFLVRQRDPERLRKWLARQPDAVASALLSTAKAAA